MSRISHHRGSSATAICFIFLLVVAVFATASAALATPSLPATVSGYVKDSGGAGIPNCLVEISGTTSIPTPWDIWNTSFSQEATTDASGLYVITDVVQGTYDYLYVNNQANNKHLLAYSEAMLWTGTPQFIDGGATLTVPDIGLADSASIHGHAMDGAVPVVGAEIKANVDTAGASFSRSLTTGADGSYTIPDATPGQWSVTISGKDRELPAGAVPASEGSWVNGAATQSPGDTFDVGEGASIVRPDTEFDLGQQLRVDAVEEHSTSTYWLPDVSVQMSLDSDPGGHTYFLKTDERGNCFAYLPAGDYTLSLQDGLGAYDDKTVAGTISLLPSAAQHFELVKLTPAPGTYAVYGKVTETGTGENVASWISASKVIPGTTETEDYRRVPSNGAGNSLYLVRLPQATGYAGHQMRLEFSDQASPRDGIPYVHVNKVVTFSGPSDTLSNQALNKGGSISGTIHDELGTPVPGCQVSVARKAFDPGMGETIWTGTGTWFTYTDLNGEYEIGGLPSNADYKVNIYPDYNPGWLLPEKYRDYYRRTYKGQPNVDSLNTSASPIGGVVDHTPVSVTLGLPTSGIDETITPGGYVALHADGPAHPTGAVWCDVMYQYKTQWFEIDSGYTTGGMFQKMWKVLPTGTYRLNYKDYFGRGSGTWDFALGATEHKYASVLVPAPMTITSGSSLLKGTFAGLLGGGSGLPGGGTGGAILNFKLGSVPKTAPPLPSGTFAVGSVYNATLAAGSASGVWTLTLPYDQMVPDADVPYLRVIHYKQAGGTEWLTPLMWNTINHTLQVQTSSLSPFRMVYRKHTVKLGTPVAARTWKRFSRHTVYGGLSPKHTSGAKSVKLVVYRRNSHGHYVLYKSIVAPNYTYRGSTRYRAKLSLKAGSYRFKAYAYSDKWHLATKTARYKSVTVK